MAAGHQTVVLDYETDPIRGRPNYPPKPCGVAIWLLGEEKPWYAAWGHPTENGMYKLDSEDGLSGEAVRIGDCDEAVVMAAVRAMYRIPSVQILHHNEKFDADVGETHHDLPILPYHQRHDTLYQLFLKNPHAMDLGLKPSAAHYLNLPPDEKDEVVDWLVNHQPCRELGITLTRSTKNDPGSGKEYAGAWICKAPGSLVAKYAIGDVVRTGKLHELLYPEILETGMREAYERELRLMPHLLENERRGMPVDVPALERDVEKYTLALRHAELWLQKRLNAPDLDFNKRNDVAYVLGRENVITEWKLTKGGKRSTSKKNMSMAKFGDQEVAQALGYWNRLHTVLSQSMEPWLEMAHGNNGAIYTQWNQVRQEHGPDGKKGTRTGRLSCSRLMNITKDFSDKGDGYEHPSHLFGEDNVLPLVRRYLLPDPGCVFGHRDYSQQEFRILAHFAGGVLKETYIKDPNVDFHNMMKQLILDITGQDIARRGVKILNFGLIYGMGAAKMAEAMGIDEMMARKLRAAQRAAVPDLKKIDKEIRYRVKNDLPIRTWGGRLYFCEPPLVLPNGAVINFGYKLLNYLVQGSAADDTKEAIIRYHEHPKRESRFLVAVHDEINASMPEGKVVEEMKLLNDVMQSVEFDIPMLSDGSYGPNWADQTTECA